MSIFGRRTNIFMIKIQAHVNFSNCWLIYRVIKIISQVKDRQCIRLILG